MTTKQTIGVRLNAEYLEKLKEMSELEGRSLSNLAEKIIIDGILEREIPPLTRAFRDIPDLGKMNERVIPPNQPFAAVEYAMVSVGSKPVTDIHKFMEGAALDGIGLEFPRFYEFRDRVQARPDDFVFELLAPEWREYWAVTASGQIAGGFVLWSELVGHVAGQTLEAPPNRPILMEQLLLQMDQILVFAKRAFQRLQAKQFVIQARLKNIQKRSLGGASSYRRWPNYTSAVGQVEVTQRLEAANLQGSFRELVSKWNTRILKAFQVPDSDRYFDVLERLEQMHDRYLPPIKPVNEGKN